MPIHHRVLKVESLQVCYSSGLHFLREAKMATQLRNFGDIQLNEKVLLVGVEKKHVRRRTRLDMKDEMSFRRSHQFNQ